MSLDVLEQIYLTPGPGQVECLNRGVRATVFGTLAAALDISVKALAHSVGLNERTIRYRTSGAGNRLSGDETERSYRAYRVFRYAKEVLGSEEAARAWMQTEQRSLGNKTPLSLLIRDVGAAAVVNVLGAIEDGGYL